MARSFLGEGKTPLVLQPTMPDVDVAAWARVNRASLDEDLARHGAVLVRGHGAVTPDRFREFGAAVSDELMEYAGGQAVRTKLDEKLYTATEYPSELEIRMHHEMSYADSWPTRLIFLAQSLATSGGETTLADSRRIHASMPEEITKVFEEKGVIYHRRYTYNRPWQKAYQTDDRSEVERMCRAASRDYEWDGDDLVTRETRPGTRRHPVTGVPVWFNFAHGFHVSRLDDATRKALGGEDAEPEAVWPSNATYGDGSPIDDDTIRCVNEVIDRHIVEVRWQVGDVLLVDNMLLMHGRRPFAGPRKLLLQMADPAGDTTPAEHVAAGGVA
jgi:alpha-ketoglutarate-dependent taurine dioxygenase